MVVVTVNRETPFAIEDHVSVDEDFGFGDYRRRPVAGKCVGTTPRGNGGANSTLAAGEDARDRLADRGDADAVDAQRPLFHGLKLAQAIGVVADVDSAGIPVFAVDLTRAQKHSFIGLATANR